MSNKTVVNKETLVPIGVVIGAISILVLFFSKFYEETSKMEVQAAEINYIKNDYIEHKQKSESYFMAISKSLARIEGKLEASK